MKKTHDTTRRITGIAIFSSLAYITAFMFQLIPPVAGFLSLDAKDAVIVIASFIYGPLAGPVISLIAALIEFLTFSTTGWYGFVMNFASSAVFSLTASLVYKMHKNFTGALVGLFSATLATTGVMILLNIFVTPLYLVSIGVKNMDVIYMSPETLLPFNFAKSLLNSSIAMIIYKPIITALRRARLVEGGQHKTDFNKTTFLTLAIGGVSLIAAIVIVVLI